MDADFCGFTHEVKREKVVPLQSLSGTENKYCPFMFGASANYCNDIMEDLATPGVLSAGVNSGVGRDGELW